MDLLNRKSRPRGRLASTWAVAGGLCLCGLTAWSADNASPPKRRHDPPAQQALDAASSRTVRMNFLLTSWPDVLAHVAEQLDLEVVADQYPEGKFSRRDSQLHTPENALKILNRELEPKGYRVLRKGRSLVLLEIPATRVDYRRPALDDRPAPLSGGDDGKMEVIRRAKTPADIPLARTTVGGFSGRGTAAGSAPARGGVRQTGYQETGARGPAAGEADSTRARNATPRPQKPVQLVLPVKNMTAIDLAAFVYGEFEAHAELVDAGPRGLPAFRVKGDRDDGWFFVGVDAKRNELVIEGPKAQAEATAALFRALDRVPGTQKSRLVTNAREAADLARTLQPALNTMAREGRKANPISRQQPREAASDAQPGEDPPMRQPPEPELPQPGETQPPDGLPPGVMAIPFIRGDVQIQSIPELNVIMITGRPEDVEAISQLIEQLQRLSLENAPVVELYQIKHVDSTAFADLLTNIYQQLGQMRGRLVQQTQQAVFIPVVKPNAVIILASKPDLEEILKLAEQLDQPVDPTAEFGVFPLRHAAVADVLTTVTDFYANRTQLGARILAVADLRTNSLIVQARSRDLQEIAALLRRIDRPGSNTVNQIKFFRLNHAPAADLAQVLNLTIQSVISPPTLQQQGVGQIGAGGAGTSQVPAELRPAKSAILQFLASDGVNERLVRSGALMDIRVSADARTNTLVITAPEPSMQLMAELVAQLDRPATAVAEVKVFTLGNSDAQQMADMLTTLFAQQQQQTGGQFGAQQGQQGLALAGAEDSTSALVPLRFTVDTRTNSIIALGGPESLEIVEAVLLRLDQSDVRQRETVLFRLKNSPATDVATAINTFLTNRRQLNTADTGLVSTVEQVEREVIVVDEPVTNTLLVSATPRYFAEIRDLIKRLDDPPPQVMIQVLLVEVTLSDTDEFGIELGIQDSVLFDRSVGGVPGFLFNTTNALGNNTAVHPAKVGVQGLSNLGMGRSNADQGFGGLVLAASSEGVSVLIRALASRRRVDILSRPQIMVLDNQSGQIQVGQNVPIVTGATISNLGTSNPTISRDNAGILLQVTPRISPDGLVVMEIYAERSQYRPNDEGVPVVFNTDGSVIRSPIKDITNAQAVVGVRSDQTVVLGGMITHNGIRSVRKVPLLGDVPVLGAPFKYELTQSERTELLMFLTPRVLRNTEDAEILKQIEIDRIHFLEEQVEQMHGPVRAAPPAAELEGTQPAIPGRWDELKVPTTRMGSDSSVPPAPPLDDEFEDPDYDGVRTMEYRTSTRIAPATAARGLAPAPRASASSRPRGADKPAPGGFRMSRLFGK